VGCKLQTLVAQLLFDKEFAGKVVMSELLLELFCEEIPARLQAKAADDLARLVTAGLKARGLAAGPARAFVTPRRLALVIDEVEAHSPALSEEKKGPRVGEIRRTDPD
jgi:glycyl-tRNA synthetase beta chain